jgi:FkbM family methyltransferase
MTPLQRTARRTAELIGRESWLIRRLRPAYESLLAWSGDEAGIPWNINGITYRVDPRQRHRLGERYDPAVAEFLRNNVKAGSLCFDVGANVGVYVLQFAHWSGPTGKVVAFEPNPAACSILERHVRMNHLSERVRIVPAAVAAIDGQERFYAAGADGMSRLGEPNRALAATAGEIVVPVVTLDQYCASQGLRPDWLLIDIEGFEIAALSGARQTIESGRGKLGMVVEMHPNVWSSANTTRAAAEDLFADLGLTVVALTGQTDPLAEHGIVHLAYSS